MKAGSRNSGQKFTMQTPPFSASARSMSSERFLRWSAIARADECDAITGAFDPLKTSKNVSSDTWETSTSIPMRCISRTTSPPNEVSP